MLFKTGRKLWKERYEKEFVELGKYANMKVRNHISF